MDEAKVCSVAWQRQHVHYEQNNTKTSIQQAAHGGDALPVVELKPFTKKVWRREKSLPNFYEKPLPRDDQAVETARIARNAPQPNIVRYIRELSEQRKTVDTRQSADSTQRYRSKLHPKADFNFESRAVSEHQQDLIPSFTTRQERTKTTLGDEAGNGVVGGPSASAAGTTTGTTSAGGGISSMGGVLTERSGATLGREFSNLMAAYTRDKPLQQQQAVLTGGKLSMANLGRRPLLYLNPFSAYGAKQPWSSICRENSPMGLSPRQAVSLSVSPRGGSGALHVSSANGHPPRRDLVLSGSCFHTPEKVVLQPLRTNHQSAHRFNPKLGAAQDSLMMLSRAGAPTVLEKNLCFDQEVRLDRCRRERSFAAVNDTNVLSSAHYVVYDSQPTRGEITLMKAREANKSRDGSKMVYRRNGMQKPFGSIPALGQSHPNVMLGRVYDNSPRSIKSELGDSGIMSSPGEPVDAEDVIGGPAAFPRDLGEEPIPEHPGDCEDGVRQLNAVELNMWAPAHSVAVLDDVEMQSPDQYRRTLSDSAATETVHERSEIDSQPAIIAPDTSISESKTNELVENKDSLRKIFQESTGDGPASHTQDMELVSVNSTAPSYGNINSARDPFVDQVAVVSEKEQSVDNPKSDEPLKPNGEIKPDESVSGVHSTPSVDVPTDLAKESEGNKPQEDQQVPATQNIADNELPSDAAKSAVTSDELSSQSHMPDTGAGEATGKSEESDPPLSDAKKEVPEQSPLSARESNTDTLQADCLDSERNVSKTTPRIEESANQGQSAQDEVGKEEKARAETIPTGDQGSNEAVPATLSEKDKSGKDNNIDLTTVKPLSTDDGVNPPTTRSEQAIETVTKANVPAEIEGEAGVEAIVTVTTEPAQTGDNFDGSKTFLTTTNVESEDWQNNMVKV
ncbi:microtubule-associated protein futsch-like [Littorina saxatilis]|uniref:microtubule-associated protein futsch-like n=1 Tax=Littorina saxatilis TaxID=31220 RepID=UPI0038B51304